MPNLKHTLLLLITLAASMPAFATVYSTCDPISSTTKSPGESRAVPILNADGSPCAECGNMQVTKDDWGTHESYKCNKGTSQDTCQPSEYEGCLAITANSLGTDPQDGSNLGYDTTFACESQATRDCSAVSTNPDGSTAALTAVPAVPFSQCQLLAGTPRTCIHLIDGTTYCDDYSEKYACYGAEGPALCNTDTNCSLASVACTETDTAATGLCSTQKQNYTCSKTQTSCLEYGSSNPNACPITLDNVKQYKVAKDKKFGESQAAIEKIGEMAKGLGDDTAAELRLFGGGKRKCDYYDSMVTGAITIGAGGAIFVTGGTAGGVIAGGTADAAMSDKLLPNCCNIDLNQPKGTLFDKCFPNEFELQAAKNGKRAVQTDAYCSKHITGTSLCIQHSKMYCAFPSMFSRIVQEQGRKQLDAYLLNKSDAGAQSASLVYPFYATAEVGKWTAPISVNGNAVAGWVWPSYCANSARYQELSRSQDFIMGTCPAEKPVTYLATCTKGTAGCGDLPVSPYDPKTGELLSSTEISNWVLAPVDASAPIHESISGAVAVKGNCDATSGNCNLDVVAWPAGSGGVSKFALPVTWMYLAPQQLASDQKWSSEPALAAGVVDDSGFVWVRQSDVPFDDLIIRPYALDDATEGTPPAFVLMQYSLDRGATWTARHIPLSVDANTLVLQANTAKFGNLDIYGRCDAATRTCTYNVLAAAPVLAKPWGSRDPDCTGFTMTQMSVLNFGAMNFSEWIAAMGITAQSKVQDVLGNAIQAQTGVSTIATRVDNNESQVTAKRDITVATVAPGVCSPTHCTLSVTATGVWPESIGANPGQDAVTSVHLFAAGSELLNLEAVRDAEGHTKSYRGTVQLDGQTDGSTVAMRAEIITVDGTVHIATANMPIKKFAVDASRLNFIFTKYTTAPMGQTADGVTYKQLKDDGLVAP